MWLQKLASSSIWRLMFQAWPQSLSTVSFAHRPRHVLKQNNRRGSANLALMRLGEREWSILASEGGFHRVIRKMFFHRNSQLLLSRIRGHLARLRKLLLPRNEEEDEGAEKNSESSLMTSHFSLWLDFTLYWLPRIWFDHAFKNITAEVRGGLQKTFHFWL